MPNILITNQAQFQPFSYQELVAPVAHQQQVLDELAEQYDKLSQQADVLEALGQNERDRKSQSYGRYKSYSDSLRAEADNLYQNGLNSQSRHRLSELRRKYNTEIIPIQNAYKKREAQALLQQEAYLKNPNLRFTRNAAETNLEDYIANPELNFGVVDMRTVASDMAEAAKNLSKQLRAGVKIEGIDPYTSRVISQHGLDPNLINEWIQNPNASPTLTNMLNQVLASHGLNTQEFVSSPNGASLIKEAIGAAQRGAWSAVGEDREQMMENFEARLMAQTQAALAKKSPTNSGELNVGEEHWGVKTADGYVSDAVDKIANLKGGTDGLKSGYFGKVAGQVNPMAIYEDYMEERKKHTKVGSTTVSNTYSGAYGIPHNSKVEGKVIDDAAARKAILAKYAKYGVTDILSKDQYDVLKAIGYDKTSDFGTKFSDINGKLNSLVTRYTRYSTNLTDYGLVHNAFTSNVNSMGEDRFKSGMVWQLNSDGSVGSTVTDVSKLNLKDDDNTKGATISNVQYDPQHKGKIILTIGKQKYIVSPHTIDGRLANALSDWENWGMHPRAITGAIKDWLNDFNPVQSKTSSNA